MKRSKRSLAWCKARKNIQTILTCCHRVDYLLEFHEVDWLDVLDNLEYIRDTARDTASVVGLDIEGPKPQVDEGNPSCHIKSCQCQYCEAERQHREDNSSYNSAFLKGLK